MHTWHHFIDPVEGVTLRSAPLLSVRCWVSLRPKNLKLHTFIVDTHVKRQIKISKGKWWIDAAVSNFWSVAAETAKKQCMSITIDCNNHKDCWLNDTYFILYFDIRYQISFQKMLDIFLTNLGPYWSNPLNRMIFLVSNCMRNFCMSSKEATKRCKRRPRSGQGCPSISWYSCPSCTYNIVQCLQSAPHLGFNMIQAQKGLSDIVMIVPAHLLSWVKYCGTYLPLVIKWYLDKKQSEGDLLERCPICIHVLC